MGMRIFRIGTMKPNWAACFLWFSNLLIWGAILGSVAHSQGLPVMQTVIVWTVVPGLTALGLRLAFKR